MSPARFRYDAGVFMRFIHYSLAAFAAVAAFALTTPAFAQVFEGEAAALYMTRADRDSNANALVKQGPNNIFTNGDVDLDWELGAEARFGARDGMWGVEVGGFFLGKQTNSATFVGNGALLQIQTTPITAYGLPAGDTLTATNTARIRGINANLTFTPNSTVTLFIGPRFIRLNESFDLFGNFTSVGTNQRDAWHTKNNMFGGQIGVRTNIFDLLGVSLGGLTLDGDLAVSLLRNKITSKFRSSVTGVQSANAASATATDVSLGFDLGVDLGYEIAQGVKVFAGYNLMYLRDVAKAADQMRSTGSYAGLAVPPTLGIRTDDILYHGFRAGIKIAFGEEAEPEPAPVAEPAPAPAPVPEPARNYLVFFDWDSTVLTQASLDIIADAAEAAKAGGTTQIDVTGHADKSGSDEYNLGLSRRRAEVVVAELVRLGVDAGEIAAFAKGETDPLVPTADGVREPQNRRVQIVLN